MFFVFHCVVKLSRFQQILILAKLSNFSRHGEKRNKFILHLRTEEKNGLVIYTSQSSSVIERGDFLSLSIVNGHAEFSFKLGKRLQPTTISSEVVKLLNFHYRIMLIRAAMSQHIDII